MTYHATILRRFNTAKKEMITSHTHSYLFFIKYTRQKVKLLTSISFIKTVEKLNKSLINFLTDF